MDLKKEVIKIIHRKIKFPHYKIFFFGSRVQNNACARSDYDIGIEVPEPISLSTLNEIRNELEELPILQQIDVVDFSTVSQGFKKVALQKIEVIYEQ